MKHGEVQACRAGSYVVIHRSSLWDLCEKYCSVVVCIDKNKVLVELGLVEQFDSVVVLKSSFTRSCGVEHFAGYATGTTTENLEILVQTWVSYLAAQWKITV